MIRKNQKFKNPLTEKTNAGKKRLAAYKKIWNRRHREGKKLRPTQKDIDKELENKK